MYDARRPEVHLCIECYTLRKNDTGKGKDRWKPLTPLSPALDGDDGAVVMPCIAECITNEVRTWPKVHAAGLNRGLIYDGDAKTDYKAKFPPGKMMIHWPLEINMSSDTRPEAKWHFTRGVTVYMLRWELNHERDSKVDNALVCECGQPLRFTRMSCAAARGHFKVILRHGQRPAVAVEAHYECMGRECKKTFGASHPHILRRLPRRYRSAYPVSPEHATPRSAIHFSDSFESHVELSMITYENAEVMMRHHRNSLSIMFEQHRSDYYEHIADYVDAHPAHAADEFPPFPTFLQWVGHALPSGDVLRDRYNDAYYAIGSAGAASSRHMFRVRQMQSVGTLRCVSSDHTHDCAKNFVVDGPKATKVWNVVTGTLTVACMLLCVSTSKSEFIHAVEEMAHRPDFRPKVHFTDTWPNDMKMWNTLWPVHAPCGVWGWGQVVSSRLTRSRACLHRCLARERTVRDWQAGNLSLHQAPHRPTAQATCTRLEGDALAIEQDLPVQSG